MAASRALAIAPLGPADGDAAVALWREAGLTRPWNDPHADFAAALACSTAATLGMCDGDRLVGSVTVGFDGHRGWLYYLAVAADRRGEGIGRAMVAAAERWLRQAGAPKVQLMLREGNGAGGFYARLGYERQPVAVWGRRLEGEP